MKKAGPKDEGYTIRIPASVERNCQVPGCKKVAKALLRHRWRCEAHLYGTAPAPTFGRRKH